MEHIDLAQLATMWGGGLVWLLVLIVLVLAIAALIKYLRG